MPRKVPDAVLALARAEAEAEFCGVVPGVLGVGVGRRQRGGRWGIGHVVTVFVATKAEERALEDGHRLPSHLHVEHRGRRWEVPVDVVALGDAPGLPQGLVVPGSQLSVAPPALAGTASWYVERGGDRFLVTAEHVVGMASRGPVSLHPQGVRLGQVTRTAWATTSLDAALVRLDPDWTGALVLPFVQHALGPPRVAVPSDTGRTGRVFLPRLQAFQPAVIRHVQVGPLPFRLPGGAILQPRSLVLTDPVTRPGDSGTLLLAADGAPVGLLTGLYVDPERGTDLYSCFTELVPALFALLA